MKELDKLVCLLEKRARKAVNNYFDVSQDSLEARFYKLVKEKKVKDDATALALLYGNGADAKGYKMLKSRLKKKLYTAVDDLDLQDNSLKPYAHDEQQCLKLLNRVNTLLRVGELELAKKVLNQATAIAKELQFASLLLLCQEKKCSIIHDEGDYSAFKTCELEYESLRKKRDIELDAQMLSLKSRFGIKSAVAGRKEFLDNLPQDIQRLERLWEESKSHLVYEQLHMLRVQYYELLGEYQKIIDLTDKAEILKDEGKISPKSLDFRFNRFIKLFALLQIRSYSDGLAYAAAIEKNFEYGSRKWVAYLENYFLLALQSKKYLLASSLVEEFSKSGATNTINEIAKERWALNIAFFNIMAEEGLCHKNIFGEELNFLLKQAVKDKQGFNVAIIILNFFELLKQREIEDTVLYSDRIRKYISKYLNKKEAERPRLFLKLVLLMFRENLDVAACKTKGRYLLQKLKNTPLPGNAFAEVEIVPYEQLWEQALHILAQEDRKALYK